jgi:outer membrane protein assembly factor BamB
VNCLAQTATSDWPQWRGPERTGISQEKGLLKQWPKEGPKLLWQVNDIGDGFSTPSVVGSRIYLMSNRGMENEFVQALSTQDGRVIWTTRVGNVGNPDQNPSYPKARSTPTADGETFYALGSTAIPCMPETRDGKVRWQKSLRKEFEGQPHDWAYAESPLVDGEALVVTPGGAKATIEALNKGRRERSSGNQPFRVATRRAMRQRLSQAGGRNNTCNSEQAFVSVDAKTGEFSGATRKWSRGRPRFSRRSSVTDMCTQVPWASEVEWFV